MDGTTGGFARAEAALAATGVPFRVIHYAQADSLAESARIRGIDPGDIVKSLVVRRGADDYLLVLVPGDREFSWPALRTALGVKRMTMPGADEAFAVTGFRRGTITPFGTLTPLPVVADESVHGRGRVQIGAGEHGVAFELDADDLIAASHATLAAVSTAPEN